MNPGRALLAVLSIYVLLAIAYIDVTPYRTAGYLPFQTEGIQKDIGAPDEWQHTNYVRYIVAERDFPQFGDSTRDFYDHYQSHQPPAYYLLCAPLAALTAGNEEAEKWALRLVNVLLGALLLLCVFKGVIAFTDNPWAGALASAFAGLLPMFIALSSAVTNDVALYLVITATMWRIGSSLRDGWTLSSAAGLGLLLGVGVLTKSGALVVWPVALVGLIAFRGSRATWIQCTVAISIAVAAALPWLLRNHALYGDILGYRIFQETFKTLPADTLIERMGTFGYWYEAVGLRALWSWWGIFGYFQITLHPLAIYDTLTVLFLLTIAGHLARKWRAVSQGELRMHLLNGILIAAVVATFVRFNTVYYQAQARYLYPALFAVAGGFACGALGWSERFTQKSGQSRGRLIWLVSAPLLVALLLVNLYAVFGALPSGFELLQRSPDTVQP